MHRSPWSRASAAFAAKRKHREMQYIVDYGISPLEAIKIATCNAAEVLDVQDRYGMIKEGLEADIIAVKGDASSDILALRDVLETFII